MHLNYVYNLDDTATTTGRLSAIFSYFLYCHIPCMVKKGEQIILYMEHKNVYSLWQLLWVVTETECSS